MLEMFFKIVLKFLMVFVFNKILYFLFLLCLFMIVIMCGFGFLLEFLLNFEFLLEEECEDFLEKFFILSD